MLLSGEPGTGKTLTSESGSWLDTRRCSALLVSLLTQEIQLPKLWKNHYTA